jgi:hypothetical protein
MARLRRLGPDGTAAGDAWEIGDGLTLGRALDCGVVLDDQQVSRRHARVSPHGSGCVVEDLGSANGVFVGDERVTRAALAPGQPFRVGTTWFVVEEAGAASAPAPPARKRGFLLGCALVGCLGLLGLLLAAGLGWHMWTSRGGQPPTTGVPPSPGPAGSAPGATAQGAPAGTPPDSVPLSEADVLRFTLRVASNPVLAGCASMPEPWQPPLVEVEVAARVQAGGAFRFERAWKDASGDHRVEGTGTWKDGALGARGRWTTRRPAGPATQEDEGSFTAAGRQVLGAWFGDRIAGEFSSRLGAATCREPVSNGLSRVDGLKW